MYPTIIIPSIHEELCKKARSFFPEEWPVIVKNGHPLIHFNQLRTLDIKTKWAINLDEDCFIINAPGVLKLIDFMEQNGYQTAGIQDGSSNLRVHNPVIFNPFFFVFDVAALQSAPTTSVAILEESPKYEHFVRYTHLPYKYDNCEPYYPFFMDMLVAGLKPLFLRNHALEAYDPGPYDIGKPSIVLDEDGNELAVHAWWSRLYHEPIIQERIRVCEEYAITASNANR